MHVNNYFRFNIINYYGVLVNNASPFNCIHTHAYRILVKADVQHKNTVHNIKAEENSEIRQRGQGIKERGIKRLEAAQMGLLRLLLSTVLQE